MAVRDGRFLQVRGGWYHYRRRVPADVELNDDRAPLVRVALKTKDLGLARARRDALEVADDELWRSFRAGDETDKAVRRYESARRRASALGLNYRTAEELAGDPLAAILERVSAAGDASNVLDSSAALGRYDRPQPTLSRAFAIYLEEIAAPELVGKSVQQRRKWRNVKERAVNSLIAQCGDKPIGDVTREDALRLYNAWLPKVAPKVGAPTRTANSANKELSSLRVFLSAWFGHFGEMDRVNPFAGLSFRETQKRRRQSIPHDALQGLLTVPARLAGLNVQARAIFCVVAETGARPSEICNLIPDHIRLDVPVPHIAIEPRLDPDNPREIKTGSSVRQVPLIGVAALAMRAFPSGFDRYRDHEEAFSAVANKYLKSNGLVEGGITVYSLRHAFEDRMKHAGLSDELRRILMGHALDRQRYGEGGSLEWRRAEMEKMVMPFSEELFRHQIDGGG
jgi:integrase